LFVGNFSYKDSEIDGYDATNVTLLGTMPVDPGPGQIAGGLWALSFGNGGTNTGDPNTLYITDGINGETDELFAAIIPNPEPSGLAIPGTALAVLGRSPGLLEPPDVSPVTTPSGGSTRRRRS